METKNATTITVETTVNAPVEKVWKFWSEPQHITKWNSGHPDWHTPRAENDLRPGGKFSSRMEAKDGSMGFDFGGTYDDVKKHKLISYTLGDGRQCRIEFSSPSPDQTKVVESFHAESQNSVEMQKTGWQSILDNFKNYTESH